MAVRQVWNASSRSERGLSLSHPSAETLRVVLKLLATQARNVERFRHDGTAPSGRSRALYKEQLAVNCRGSTVSKNGKLTKPPIETSSSPTLWRR